MTKKCNMCHSVPAEGIVAKAKIEKMKGPDIDGSSSVDTEQLVKYLRKEIDNALKNRVRVSVIGRRDRLAPRVVAAIEDAERATADCDRRERTRWRHATGD